MDFLQSGAYFTENSFFLLSQDMTHKNVDFARDHLIKYLSDIFLILRIFTSVQE